MEELKQEITKLQEKYAKESSLLGTANEELDRGHRRLLEMKESSRNQEEELKTVRMECQAEVENMVQKLREVDDKYSSLKKKYDEDVRSKGRIPGPANEATRLKQENENLEDDNHQLRVKIGDLEKQIHE